MRGRQVDFANLSRASVRLGETVLDPTIWPNVMEQICASVGSVGAVLLQGHVRTADVPRTASITDAIDQYFNEGWHERDLRVRGVPLLLQGQPVVVDQELVTPEEMQREAYYNEFIFANGVKWSAVVGFFAGPSLWTLSLQRTVEQGPFEAEERRVLAGLSSKLTEAATLSTLVGRSILSGTVDALGLAGQPALVLDKNGFVLGANRAAENIFDNEIRIKQQRLFICDKAANSKLETLIQRMAATSETSNVPSEPFVVRRRLKKPIIIRTCPVAVAARGPFLGGRVILLLSELGSVSPPAPTLLAQAFDLTPAEARLAALIATGEGPEKAAQMLGITRETARSRLKAVFEKTGTHRQSELVAMISKL